MAGIISSSCRSVEFSSYPQMQKWAQSFAKTLRENEVIALAGELGTGKTSFVKEVAASLGKDASQVTSPTFTYCHIYEKEPVIYHFDLFRLTSKELFIEKGGEEYFFMRGICFIEWPEVIQEMLPAHTRYLHWEFLPVGRKLTLSSLGA